MSTSVWAFVVGLCARGILTDICWLVRRWQRHRRRARITVNAYSQMARLPERK